MPNKTLYITQDVWNQFEQEPAKGPLVNRLLADHYGLENVNIKQNPDGTVSPEVVGEFTRFTSKKSGNDFLAERKRKEAEAEAEQLRRRMNR